MSPHAVVDEQLSHEVVSATWDADAGKWMIQVKDLATGQVHEDVADFIIHGTGLLSKPQWPSIQGESCGSQP